MTANLIPKLALVAGLVGGGSFLCIDPPPDLVLSKVAV